VRRRDEQLSDRCLRFIGDGLPLGGRRVRRGRELHRVRRGVSGDAKGRVGHRLPFGGRRHLRRRRGRATARTTTCPTNVFVSSSTVCRSAAGVCDVAESCTGSAAACPSDAGRAELDGLPLVGGHL
jgi:hypothetical protein